MFDFHAVTKMLRLPFSIKNHHILPWQMLSIPLQPFPTLRVELSLPLEKRRILMQFSQLTRITSPAQDHESAMGRVLLIFGLRFVMRWLHRQFTAPAHLWSALVASIAYQDPKTPQICRQYVRCSSSIRFLPCLECWYEVMTLSMFKQMKYFSSYMKMILPYRKLILADVGPIAIWGKNVYSVENRVSLP